MSEAARTLTPIWQLPSVPEYCRATQGEDTLSQSFPYSGIHTHRFLQNVG
ncbi:hypothetical protein ACFRQM_41130 [Streptomyces sp. NPDC056831]